jgi:ferric enterobactin receptor
MKSLFMASVLLLCILSSTIIIAQSKTVTGTVTDAAERTPLQLLTVKIKGENKGVATNGKGFYSINTKEGDVLQFMFIGYVTQEVKVGAVNVIDISMRVDSRTLSDVVVTGYGITKDKASLGYSVQEVKGEDIAQSKRENFLNGLAGRVAGASITPSSGTPGASTQIILRGAVSIGGNNQPLMVVDGLPISNNTLSQANLLSASTTSGTQLLDRSNDYSNRGIDINPEDIESVTVLKGPEAVTIYGTEGASGAIVITTRKAKSGKARIVYDNSFRWEKVTRLPETQTTYSQGRDGVYNPLLATFGGPKYADSVEVFDNINHFFHTGFTQRHNLTIEGGTQAATVRMSAGYIDQQGVIPTTRFQKSTVRLSANAKLSPKLNFSSAFTYVNTNNIKASRGSGGYLFGLLAWPSNDDIRVWQNDDGSRRKLGIPTETDNPFFDVYKNQNSDKGDRVMGNMNLSFDPLKWLNVTGIGGVDAYSTQGNYFRHPESRAGSPTGGFISDYTENSRMLNSVIRATAKKKWGKFDNSLVIATTYDINRYTTVAQRGERLSMIDFNSMNNADPTTIANKRALKESRKWAMFSTLSIGYDNILFGSVTWRRDYASRLGLPMAPDRDPNYRVPPMDYTGASLSYVFSRHGFLQQQKVLTFGKLRFSYAGAGKEPYPNYILGDIYSPNPYQGGGFFLGSTGGNPKLQPEFTNNFEVGTELQFLKNRIGIDLAIYKMKSTNQVLDVRTSYGTGTVITYFNGGRVDNNGFEIQLKGTPVQKKNFTWNVLVNMDRNVGTIISMPTDAPEYSDFRTFGAGDVRPITFPGAFTSSLSTRKYQRSKDGSLIIDPVTGLPLRETDYTLVADRNPKFKMGLVNDLTIGNFTVSLNADIRIGGDVYNGNESFFFSNLLSKRTLDREEARVIKGVLKDGLENTDHPTPNNVAITPYYSSNYYNISSTTVGFSDEDFIEKNIKWFRVRDVTVSYRFPKNVISKTKLFSNARAYITVTDPLLITNYSGADPMANYTTSAIGGYGTTGIDYGNLAMPIGFNVGFTFNF